MYILLYIFAYNIYKNYIITYIYNNLMCDKNFIECNDTTENKVKQ